MNLKTVIDPSCEEEVVILRVRKRTPLVEAIEQLVRTEGPELIGYRDREGTRLDPAQIYCVTVEGDRVYALTEGERYQLKGRLYHWEEMLPRDFVRIHQSALANLRQVDRFDASVSGTLKVIFKNGAVEYVSRRNVRAVKERLGLK